MITHTHTHTRELTVDAIKLLQYVYGVVKVTLGDIAEYGKTRISATEVTRETYVGVDNILPDKAGKVESSYVPTKGNLIKYEKNDILIGNIRPYLKKIWHADCAGGTNGDVLVVHKKMGVACTERYLFHVLSSDNFFIYNTNNSKGAKMPRGDKEAILRYKIPLPPLAEQQRIVDVLDKFDTLVHSLSEGLPKEIEQRQQQYEYYRDKLLDFETYTL